MRRSNRSWFRRGRGRRRGFSRGRRRSSRRGRRFNSVRYRRRIIGYRM